MAITILIAVGVTQVLVILAFMIHIILIAITMALPMVAFFLTTVIIMDMDTLHIMAIVITTITGISITAIAEMLLTAAEDVEVYTQTRTVHHPL